MNHSHRIVLDCFPINHMPLKNKANQKVVLNDNFDPKMASKVIQADITSVASLLLISCFVL